MTLSEYGIDIIIVFLNVNPSCLGTALTTAISGALTKLMIKAVVFPIAPSSQPFRPLEWLGIV